MGGGDNQGDLIITDAPFRPIQLSVFTFIPFGLPLYPGFIIPFTLAVRSWLNYECLGYVQLLTPAPKDHVVYYIRPMLEQDTKSNNEENTQAMDNLLGERMEISIVLGRSGRG